jgi:hypothetical protein
VGELPELFEAEPNDAADGAPLVALPSILNGRIAKPGDRDLFRFLGRAGERIVAEVTARSLLSPLDSLLRLRDASGKVLAWNDDSVDKQGHLHRRMGILTHHSDSYLSAELPADGVYCIEITDAQGRGARGFAYRLRLGPPRADFALRVTPSAINLQPGRATVIHVHALRTDGFDGEIEVRLKDAPEGFILQGNVIPRGRDHVRMTLTAATRGIREPVLLRMEGTARVGERELCREVVPSDNVMQAFLWRHLVPSRELLVLVLGRGDGRANIERLGEDRVEIPSGGTERVWMVTPNFVSLPKVEFELNGAPKGITLEGVKFLPVGVGLTLKADREAAAEGLADNLIVDVFMERKIKRRGGKEKVMRLWIGTLPAIPFRVVKQ